MEVTNANPITGTNVSSAGIASAAVHLPRWLQPEWLQILLIALAAVVLYYGMVLVGRGLKHRQGVRLGILYHVFSLGFAIFLPAALMRPDWTIVNHIGAFTVIFGGVF